MKFVSEDTLFLIGFDIGLIDWLVFNSIRFFLFFFIILVLKEMEILFLNWKSQREFEIWSNLKLLLLNGSMKFLFHQCFDI